MKCNNCGASLERTATFCGYCGTAVASGSATAQSAAVPMPTMATASATTSPFVQAPAPSDADLKPFYREEFARLDTSQGANPKFNWWAFGFCAFWYMSKGMWAKGLMLFAFLAVTGGAAAPIAWAYAGFRGNADYWLLRRHGKQLW